MSLAPRRSGPFRGDLRPPGERRRAELAAFARAGFTRRIADSVLACHDEVAVQALLAGDDTDGSGL